MGLCFVKAPNLPPAPPGGYGQSLALQKILKLAKGGEGDSSPPPSVQLNSVSTSNILDGTIYCELIRAGFVQLALNYQHCNKINVFPVPDGDTGNNMVISTRGAVVAMTKTPPSALSASAMLVAGQTAICSTGNSGTLLSYMFNKISDGFRETAGGDTFDSLTLDQVAVILNAVGKDMSNAMTNAVPGTLVSVICDCLCAATGNTTDLKAMITAMQMEGNASLQRTPEQLVVNGKYILKDAGVVDSGAQGFMYMIDGMLLAINGTLDYGEYLLAGSGAATDYKVMEEKVIGTGNGDPDPHAGHDHGEGGAGEMKFPFCTECVGELKPGTTSEMIKQLLAQDVVPSTSKNSKGVAPSGGSLGDSIAVTVSTAAPGCDVAKVHIHSNYPQEVFERMSTLTKDGYLFKEKAEDMRKQVALTNGPFRAIPSIEDTYDKCGILFDSTADLPEDFMTKWKDYALSLYSVVDACSYRDRIDIDARTLSNIVRCRAFETVGTSGISAETVSDKVTLALSKHKTVLIMTLPHLVSEATYNNITRVLSKLPAEDRQRIVHYNTQYTTIPSWFVMRAFYLSANQNLDANAISLALTTHAKSGGIFFGGIVPELGYLRRGGRFDHLMGKLCGIVGKVLIKAELDGKSFCFHNSYDKPEPMKPGTLKAQVVNIGPKEQCKSKTLKVMQKCAQKYKGKQQFDFQITHQCEPWTLEWFKNGVRDIFGDKVRNIYVAEQSCVLLTASGRGVVILHMWPADEIDFPYQ